MGLINLCKPEFDVTNRWQLFCIYLAVVAVCLLLNLFNVKGIGKVEAFGCWITAFTWLAFSILLLVRAPKSSAQFVFVEATDSTGYDSVPFAVLLGLMNSFATLMALDGPAHLAEELAEPKRILPKVMLIVIVSQVVIGTLWILVLGFCITDIEAVTATVTGVPVLELVRLGAGSDGAAIALCVRLIVNNWTSAVGSGITMSRQGYAFARDGGLVANKTLIKLSGRDSLPIWSIILSSTIVALIGIIYLFSSTAFDAIVGSQAACMILSYACPAAILLVTSGSTLPFAKSWNFGRFSMPLYATCVVYAALVVVVAFIPQSRPITSLTMNYTILVMGVFFITMFAAWHAGVKKVFVLPVNPDESAGAISVLTGVAAENGDSTQTSGKVPGKVDAGDVKF